MTEKREFFQDYLFEGLPVDEFDNPVVELSILQCLPTSDVVEISFDSLLKSEEKSEWDSIHKSVENKVAVIKDDVRLRNDELEQYKDFYLKAYYYDLCKYARECYVLN